MMPNRSVAAPAEKEYVFPETEDESFGMPNRSVAAPLEKWDA